MTYTAPLADMRFALREVAGLGKVAALPGYEHATDDTVDAVLEEAAKLAGNGLAPLNRDGDKVGAKLENGVVRTAPGFTGIYKEFVDGGWNSLPFDPENAPVEGPPLPSGRRAPSVPEILARANSTRVIGPGIVPQVEPRVNAAPHEFTDWSRTNVRAQKQAGWSMVVVATVLGDLTSAQFRLVGELAAAYGDGTVRITSDQNVVFRWVHSRDVEALYRSLHAAGLSRGGAGTVADVTSCPGAESCKLAVTQSRGLGRLLGDRLQARPDLVAAAPGLDIKISGCPNGCGQHHIAGIGFQGSLRKVGGRPAPHYFVMVGGGVGDGTTTFGRLATTVPARRCDEALERLIGLYREQRTENEAPITFFRRVDLAAVKSTLAGLDKLDPATATVEDFTDLAEDHAFNPEVQEGECSA